MQCDWIKKCWRTIVFWSPSNCVRASLFLALVVFAIPFGIDHTKTEAEQPTQDNRPLKEVQREPFWVRTLDDPVALFTLVLSVSTIGLWIVTWRGMSAQSKDMQKSLEIAKISADAAKQSTDILVAQNRPMIYLRDIIYDRLNQIAIVGNIGRTHAISIASCVEFTNRRDLPEFPEYRNVSPETRPIPADGSAEFRSAVQINSPSVADNARRIAGETIPTTYGFIRYRDAEGAIFDMGFCWRHDPIGLRMASPENYTYVRRVA